MSKRRYMIELEEIVDVSEVDNSRVYPNQEIKVMTSDKVHLKKRLDDWAELIKLRSQIKIA